MESSDSSHLFKWTTDQTVDGVDGVAGSPNANNSAVSWKATLSLFPPPCTSSVLNRQRGLSHRRADAYIWLRRADRRCLATSHVSHVACATAAPQDRKREPFPLVRVV